MARALGTAVAEILSGSWRVEPGTAKPSATWNSASLDDILISNGAAGLAYRRLAEEDRSSTLATAAKTQALRNLLQTKAIHTIADDLDSLGVRYAFLKGWVAARPYADSGLRLSGDIDFLVEPAAVQSVMHHFWPDDAFPWSNALDTRVNPTFEGIPGHISIDVHDNLEKHGLEDTSALLRSVVASDVGGRSLPHLAEALHFRQLCAHGLTHGYWRPLWLCDIAAYVEAHGADMDWSHVVDNDRVLENWVSISLALAKDLLGADISSAAPHLEPAKVPNWMRTSVLEAWGRSFIQHHNRQALRYTLLTAPWKVPKQVWIRRPNTLTAIAQMRQPVPSHRSPLITLRYLIHRARQALAPDCGNG